MAETAAAAQGQGGVASEKSSVLDLGLGDCVDDDMFGGGAEVGAASPSSPSASSSGRKKKAKKVKKEGDAKEPKAGSNSKGKGGKSARGFKKGQTEKICRLCLVAKPASGFSGTKPDCRECHPDFEAAKRDAMRQQQLKLFNDIAGDDDLLRKFIADWKKNTPPARGAGHRRGGYKFVQFKKMITAAKGVRKARNKVMKTKKAFCDFMEGKGMERAAAEKEFNRRLLGNTEWRTSVDEDTGLPTVQCWGEAQEEEYDDNAMTDVVELTTKQQAANKRNVHEMLEDFGSEPSSSVVAKGFAEGSVADLIPEFNTKAADDFSVADFIEKATEGAEAGQQGASEAAGSGGADGDAPASSPKKGRTDDYWDGFNLIADARDKMVSHVDLLQQKVDDMVNSMRESELQGQALVKSDPACFEGRQQALKRRLACLMIVACDVQDDLDKHKNNIVKEAAEKSGSEAALVHPVPFGILEELRTLRCLREEAQTLGEGVATATGLATTIAAFEAQFAPVNTLLVACRSAVKGLKNAQAAKEAHERNRVARLHRAENAEKARLAKAKSDARKKPGASEHAVFDLDLAMAVAVPQHTQDTLAQRDYNFPYVVRPCQLLKEIADRGPVKINSMVFKAGILKSSEKRSMRRLTAMPEVRD